MTDFLQKFEAALCSMPSPGGGGCHTAQLGAANYAALARIPESEAVQRIHDAIPPGGRTVSLREVRDSVRKAYCEAQDAPQGAYVPRRYHQAAKRPEVDTKRFWREALNRYPEESDPLAELWERSPVRLDGLPAQDTALLLSTLYAPDECLYIGDAKAPGILGENIRRVSDWLAHLGAGGVPGPHIIPNPLTGREGLTKDKTPTLRGDACVAAWRFVVCEFDGIPKHEQAAFWLYARLPVAVVLDSGGKSLHGWIRVDCAGASEWEREIEQELFPHKLKLLGADGACKNEARMSRTPGVRRDDNWQRLLYLNPEAGRVKP